MKLELGNIEVAYTNAEGQGTTTTDVAAFLEADYHIMETFYDLNKDFIADTLANEMAGALETIAMGGPSTINFDGAMSKIEERFKDFISSGDLVQGHWLNEPIQAAIKGVSHRKKTPNAKDNPARVAFVDTGLYVGSFKAWLTGKLN